MRTLIAMLVLGLISACDGQPSAATAPGGGAEPSGTRTPKWKVDYTGGFEGSVQGSILNVQTMIPGNVVLAGGAISPDRKSKATEQLSATIVTSGSSPTATVKLTLADGTKCRSSDEATAKIIDGDGESFRAELSGALACDGGQAVDFEAAITAKR